MKLRDFIFLLLLLNLPFSCLANFNQDCDDVLNTSVDETAIALTVSLRIMDSLTSQVKGFNIVSPLLWATLDLNHQDGEKYKQIINCHIDKRQRSRLLSIIMLHDKDRLDAAKLNNTQELEDIRNQIEFSNNMAEVWNLDQSAKAAIYPLLPYWSAVHLNVYTDLIKLTGLSRYELKHDEWAVFYAKLILRYWRPYRRSVMKRTNKINTWRPYPTVVSEHPAENLLQNFTSLPHTSKGGHKMLKLLESCKVKKGSRVMFNSLVYVYRTWGVGYIVTPPRTDHEVGKYWWSCWKLDCRLRTCPSKYEPSSPFLYDKTYGIKCRGEAFWIYSNNQQIKDKAKVHIKYSTINNKGYWVSSYNSPLLVHGELSDPKTCPGKNFLRIFDTTCQQETFIIQKTMSTTSQEEVYDGNLISLNRVLNSLYTRVFDIYLQGAESLEGKMLYPPSRSKWHQYLNRNYTESPKRFWHNGRWKTEAQIYC